MRVLERLLELKLVSNEALEHPIEVAASGGNAVVPDQVLRFAVGTRGLAFRLCALRFARVMSALEAAEEILAKLTRAEKAQLLRWTASDLSDAFPGIESRPGVCGGEPCVVRTRIPVWVLEQARRLGVSESDLLGSYPTLRAEDLANAWAYVRSHREEINRQIEENEAD